MEKHRLTSVINCTNLYTQYQNVTDSSTNERFVFTNSLLFLKGNYEKPVFQPISASPITLNSLASLTISPYDAPHTSIAKQWVQFLTLHVMI